MIVKKYIKEFSRLNIRDDHIKEDVEKISRSINGLRYEIQDEISLFP